MRDTYVEVWVGIDAQWEHLAEPTCLVDRIAAQGQRKGQR